MILPSGFLCINPYQKDHDAIIQIRVPMCSSISSSSKLGDLPSQIAFWDIFTHK